MKFACDSMTDDKRCTIGFKKMTKRKTKLVICCYYCEHIRECFANWNKKPYVIFCKKEGKDVWCDKARRLIEAYGFNVKEFVFR